MISSLLIKPAGPDCNLACSYCFYRPALGLYPEAPHPRMSVEVLREVVRQYMTMAWENGTDRAQGSAPTGEAGPAAFCWQGGEPTLMGVDFYRTVIALQKKHGHSGQVVANSLQTNGMLIDEEWARLLARYRFLVGVSIDGPAEVHDHYRVNMGGQPTLARVLRGLKTLQRHQVEANALCMITSFSASRAGMIWDFLREQKLDYLQFIPCLERERPAEGEAGWKARGPAELADFAITPEQYGEFLCEIFDLWWPERETMHVRVFDDLLADLLGVPESKTCEFRPRCGDYLVVEHNGDVFDCDFFVDREHQVGNLMQTPLAELAQAESFGAFALAKSCYGGQCQGCEWLSLCCGGCQKHRMFGEGKIDAPSYLCAGYRQLFEHALPRLRGLAEE
ncbi:MAG: anaerobic sulfatase maturase [Armatimonadota bacterium]